MFFYVYKIKSKKYMKKELRLFSFSKQVNNNNIKKYIYNDNIDII